MNFNNKEAFNSLPDAILFDLDNTLYAYEPAHKAAWYKVIKKVTSLFMIEGIQFSKAGDLTCVTPPNTPSPPCDVTQTSQVIT